MNDTKIQKIRVIYNPDTKKYEKGYITVNGKTIILTSNIEIKKYISLLMSQEGKSLNELGREKLQTVFSTSAVAKDMEEAWDNQARIVSGKINKENPHTGKTTKEMPKKKGKIKKALITVAAVALSGLMVTSCGLADKIANMFTKDKKSITEEETSSLNVQLTDKDILSKDFDYYADNYDYSIQQEVAFTANAFLEQANTNIKNMGLKTEDGKDITGLFTEEEAWVYAITINNLRVDQVLDVYKDSKFDFEKFEDTKEMMITKMMQYQMLVSFGKVDQLDFTSEFMVPHDDFAKEVFNTLATDIEEIGKNINDKTECKDRIKKLHDDLDKYANSGSLSQNLQDMLQVMYSPAYFSGELTEYSHGKLTYFTDEFGEDLVGKGLCTTKSTEEHKEIEQEVQSQHDSAWADSAATFREVQDMNSESYQELLTNNNEYVYWINEACQTLANEASREDKHLYATITKDNAYDVHAKAEELITDYLVTERDFEVGSNALLQAKNNIITDGHDGILTVETALSLISDNALIKGYSAYIDGYSLEELQYQLSQAVNKEISSAMLSISGGLSNGGGSTVLPKNVEKQITITRDEAVAKFGESAVQEAEKAAHDNEASKQEAQDKADKVKQEAQDNLDDENYDDFINNAGKNDPENEDEYKKNAEEAVKNKEETEKIKEEEGPSGEENINQNLDDMVNEEDGYVEVPRGETPEGEEVYEGDPSEIEWSTGETLGGNADQVTKEMVEDPTASIKEESTPTPEVPKEETPAPEDKENSGSVSGGDINYDIPQDLIDGVEPQATSVVIDAQTPAATSAPVVTPEPAQNVVTDSTTVIGGDVLYSVDPNMIDEYIKELENYSVDPEVEASHQKTL